jgi:hypothetical protein
MRLRFSSIEKPSGMNARGSFITIDPNVVEVDNGDWFEVGLEAPVPVKVKMDTMVVALPDGYIFRTQNHQRELLSKDTNTWWSPSDG